MGQADEAAGMAPFGFMQPTVDQAANRDIGLIEA